MKLGVSLPQARPYDHAHDVVAFAREAERLGYDSLWAFERVLTPVDQSGAHGLYGVPGLAWPETYRDVADPLITLAQAAAVTSRVALGTGVLVAPLHNPVRLARTLASVDAASGGRLIAGLGSGWSADEFAAVAPRPIAERGAALDEFLDTADAVWGADPVAVAGSGFTVVPAWINPKPVAGRVPVYLGGASAPALRRIARRGLGWLPTGLPPAHVGTTLDALREQAGQEVPCIVQINYFSLAEAPAGRDPYIGSPAQLAYDLVALREVGVEHVYVTLPYAVRDLTALIDAAGEVHDAATEAGVLTTRR